MAAPMQQQMPNPQQQPSGGQQQPQQAQQSDLDPITKFKTLLPRLRESLVNLFKDAAQIFRLNAAHDSGNLPDSYQRERFEKFEKRLEDFCGICDQIEISLRLALELHHQTVDSLKNTPLAVMIPGKPDQSNVQQEGQSYAQYLTTMRQQINYAKEIHDLLHESVTKLMEKTQPQPPPPPPPPVQAQQQHTPTQQQQQD